MPTHLYLVLVDARAGEDEAFNTWYDDVHLADVLDVPGFVNAKRYRLDEAGGATDLPSYLTLYEVETDDPGATQRLLVERLGDGRMAMSSAFDTGRARA